MKIKLHKFCLEEVNPHMPRIYLWLKKHTFLRKMFRIPPKDLIFYSDYPYSYFWTFPYRDAVAYDEMINYDLDILRKLCMSDRLSDSFKISPLEFILNFYSIPLKINPIVDPYKNKLS